MPRRNDSTVLGLRPSFGLWPKLRTYPGGKAPITFLALTAGHRPASHQTAKPQQSD
jgi:hypothetical protein